ncbi:MAG TPA: efflux RND transporter periplasmic adaptor subunit [Polyangiaceae bacterium]
MNARIFCGLLLVIGCNEAQKEPLPSSNAGSNQAPAVEIVGVTYQPLDTVLHLDGELSAYESVELRARANGYLARVLVDRGSRVKQGQLLATIVAPELNAQRAEAESKLEGDRGTYQRLLAAAKTPGAVADDELERASATMKADRARVDSLKAMEQYLAVTAPFEGVITERNVHPGALVGPQAGTNQPPMLKLEQVQKLRLTVPVPESLAGAIAPGAPATFSVRAFPGQKFSGVTSRIARSIDAKTRAMSVELDVDNENGALAPGMFADVSWPVKRAAPSLFVPQSAFVQSTEKTFVVRVKDGTLEQVPVQRGVLQGDLLEIFGPLQQGDQVARRASEDLRTGVKVAVRAPAPTPSASAAQ